MRTRESILLPLVLILTGPAVAFAGAPDAPATNPAGRPAAPAFVLTGKVAAGQDYVFSLKPNRPAARAEWMALGATIEGYKLVSFDHPSNTLTLEKSGETLRIPMENATIQPALTPAERRQRDLERMAAMKPAFERGQPIKGEVVFLVGGEVRSQPVELAIGRETRIDAGPDGIYTILPKLEPTGTVRYVIALLAREAGETAGDVKLKTNVIQTPWAGFSFVAGGGHGFGFVPATGEPSPGT